MKSDTEAESDTERYCPLCWRPIPPDVDYCPVCNVKAETDTSTTRPAPLTLTGATATVASAICIIGGVLSFSYIIFITNPTVMRMSLAITLFDFIGLIANLTASTNAREKKILTQTITATGLLMLTGILNLIAAHPYFNAAFNFGTTTALAFGVPITVLAVLMLASVAVKADEFTG